MEGQCALAKRSAAGQLSRTHQQKKKLFWSLSAVKVKSGNEECLAGSVGLLLAVIEAQLKTKLDPEPVRELRHDRRLLFTHYQSQSCLTSSHLFKGCVFVCWIMCRWKCVSLPQMCHLGLESADRH